MKKIKNIIILHILILLVFISFGKENVSAEEIINFGEYITFKHPKEMHNLVSKYEYSLSKWWQYTFCNGLWVEGSNSVFGFSDELFIQYRGIDGTKNEVENEDYYIKKKVFKEDSEYIIKEIVYIDGIKALHLRYNTNRYQLFNGKGNLIADEYFFCTDNGCFEFIYTSYGSSLDKDNYKNFFNSIKINDTVKGSRIVPFKDVQTTAWYYNAVKYNWQNNIVKGINNYTFAPNNKVTRGMVATMLYSMAGAPKVTGTCKFSDVSSSKYYYNAILWASQNKVINGYSGTNKFGPDDYVTREQLATMLTSYSMYNKKYTPSNVSLNKFSDYAKVSNWAQSAVKWATANKIINGTNGKINPQGHATRAEVATMIYSYYLNIK